MKFNFHALTQSPERLNVVTCKLGVDKTKSGFTDQDIGKPMKMGQQGNFSICAAGDEIEGFLDSIDGGPTADGMTVGGVASGNRGLRVQVQVSGEASVLDYVVAAAQAAIGAQDASGYGVVEEAFEADGVTKTKSNWRIVSFADDSVTATDTIAVIERQ